MTANSIQAQKNRLKFEHIGTTEGLSQGSINCTLQDSRGFLWFGTRDGLNKYDGYKFTVYRNDPGNVHSLSNNSVRDIVEDSSGNLWIGTLGGGLNMFDRNLETFTVYKHDEQNQASISTDLIICLLIDDRDRLWVGTRNKGLDLFDLKAKTFTHYSNDQTNPGSLSDNDVRDIALDSQHRLWVATNLGGLNLFDEKSKTFKQYKHDDQQPSSISSNRIWCVYEDSSHRLWAGTYGGGLNLFHPESDGFEHFKKDVNNSNSLPHDVVISINEDHSGKLYIGTENGGLSIFDPKEKIFHNYLNDDSDPTSLSSNSINSIYSDRKGNMWIGTFNGGLNFVSRDAGKFIHYKYDPAINSLSSNKVLTFCEDSDDNIWIGTDGGGLNRFDPVTETFTHFKHEEGNINTVAGNYILKVFEDSEKNLWVGTWGDGLTVYNRYKNTFRHFKHDPSRPNSLSNNNCWGIYEDRDKNIWIGTFGGGLDLYNRKEDTFTHFKHDDNDPQSIGSDKVYSITEDRPGRLLIGTDDGGFNIFNKKTRQFTVYEHAPDKNSITNNNVDCILEDRSGNIWLSTDAGLNHFDPKTKKFTSYYIKDGLPNDMIMGIIEDDRGNLWISTNRGISVFNPKTKVFKNYSTADGLQANEFKEEAFCKSRSGTMYFGGINGFNKVFPSSVKDSKFEPPLVLTNFQIFNKDVSLPYNRKTSPLSKAITETREITLSYKQSVITFEFASLNYGHPEKKQYAYVLKGFDKDWNYIGTQHTATYTNLDGGEYFFIVKGLDNQGNWLAGEINLKLTIIPPFWQTWWFRSLVMVLVTISFFAFFRIRMGVIQKQKIQLQHEVEERTKQLVRTTEEAQLARQEAERATQAKSIFLATMSHEIRTPMNGVLGMASLMAETSLTEEQREYNNTIQNSGETLLGVINDILDFSKIESGKMELENNDFNLRDCVEEVLDMFAAKAAQSGLDLIYEIEFNVPAQIIGDSLRLRQVLINLVSNAIKFTHRGEIFIAIRLLKAIDNHITLAFEVRDTGIGIPADKLERLFKAFSQVDSSTTRRYGGTGLGLAISEKLIGLMGGQIQVESQPAVGTKFMFSIETEASLQTTKTYVHLAVAGIEGKYILVVDDNETNRAILKNQLEQWKLIPVMAQSGKEAIHILSDKKYKFDLILTDMQMPDMDGLELAQKIRNEFPLLPILLLTSIGDERAKQHGNVFNAIMTKPVKQQILHKHLLNQLRHGSKLLSEEYVEKKKLSALFAQEYPLNILIAEDNIVNQKLAARVLEKLGYKADIANNGYEVLETIKTKDYTLIFMDVQMPEMDGLEATRIVRSQQQEQPIIIAMTANAMQGDREVCLASGMDDYISKPIKLEALVQLLEKWAPKKTKALNL
ncbi:MAG TPA: two-component regulator propeller domain-containing protein [Chryseolinea sp.]|nr:two-component regulator propeller domain-containing protein [Chryseolinea sp.]